MSHILHATHYTRICYQMLAALYGPVHWVGAEKLRTTPPRPGSWNSSFLALQKSGLNPVSLPHTQGLQVASLHKNLPCSIFCSEAGRRRRGPNRCRPKFSERVAGPVGVCRAELGPGCGPRSLSLGVWPTGRGAECSEISRSLRKGVLAGRRQRSPAAVVPQAGEMSECGAAGAEARAATASPRGLFVPRRMG